MSILVCPYCSTKVNIVMSDYGDRSVTDDFQLQAICTNDECQAKSPIERLNNDNSSELFAILNRLKSNWTNK